MHVAVALTLALAAPLSAQDAFEAGSPRAAARAACDWLVTVQHSDGHWSPDALARQGSGAAPAPVESEDAFWERVLSSEPDPNSDSGATDSADRFEGEPLHSVGVTSLAVLALVQSGNTLTAGPHAESVQRGVKYLLRSQDLESGLFGKAVGTTFHYDHALATYALSELCGTARSPSLGSRLALAAGYIQRARNPYRVWRYSMPPTGDNDTSVTTWMALALDSIRDKNAGIALPDEAFDAILHWIDDMTDPDTGVVGYTERGSPSARVSGVNDQFGLEQTETLTAAALLVGLELGRDPLETPNMVRQTQRVLRTLTSEADEDGADAPKIFDALWLYYGTRATKAIGSRPWEIWSEHALPRILRAQATSGEENGIALAGSWDPTGAWGYASGRIGTTALLSMTLSAAASSVRQAGSVEVPLSAASLDSSEKPRAGGKAHRPIQNGLDWLAAHQDESGRWDCDEFFKHDPVNDRTDGPGLAVNDVGVTGLALLAFLGDGHSLTRGPYQHVVERGVEWIIAQQDEATGLIGDQNGFTFLYDHAIATLALCEVNVIDESRLAADRAQKAVDYILRARNPYRVWRYSVPPDGSNDTSVTGWMILALTSARDGGLEVPNEPFDAALDWFDRMTDPDTGRVGYTERGTPSSRVHGVNEHHPTEHGEALTAMALLCRIFLGQDPSGDDDIARQMRQHANLVSNTLPRWSDDGLTNDMYYWYFGSYAMWQMGGDHWKAWERSMKEAILDSQRTGGSAEGSWDPNGPWGYAGGRVYSTALMVLCLEVDYRYGKILGTR